MDDVKEFVFAVIIIATTLGAGCTIYQNGQGIASLPQSQNQANVLGANPYNY